MSDGGKGSARRPMQVADEQYAERWDLIFARDKQPAKEQLTQISQDLGEYDGGETTEANCSGNAVS